MHRITAEDRTVSIPLMPGILSLALFQRLRVVATSAIMISLVFSLCGYLISFSPEGIPTEPKIIVFLEQRDCWCER